jgi:hypothetical protein
LPAGIRRIAAIELTDRQILPLAVFCCVSGIFYYVFKANFSPSIILDGLMNKDRFSGPWARDQLGDWTSFIEQLTYFGYLLPALTTIVYMRSHALINGKTLFCIALSACFLVFLAQGGGRTAIGTVLGSAILIGVLLNRRALRTIHVVSMLAMAFAAQFAMNIILENRSHGFSSLEAGDWVFTTVRVDDNFNRLAQTADFVPAYYPYSGLQFVYFALARPIPRALWPGKPINQGFTVQSALHETDTSFTTSVIGEAYAGFGFPLVLLIGMFFGSAARWWEQTLQDAPTAAGAILYAFGAMALFGALRGFVNIILLSYPVLSFWAVFNIFQFAWSRSSARPRSV